MAFGSLASRNLCSSVHRIAVTSFYEASKNHGLSRLGRVVVTGLLGISLAAQAWEIRHRGIDPDELVNHLHNAFSVWTGDVIYRDFFAYHGPALSYLLQPLFWIVGPELSVLWWGRALNWLLAVGTLAATGRIAHRLGGSGAGWIAAVLLAGTTIFHHKAIELRPDVPAMLLVVLAAWVLLGSVEPWTLRRRVAAGLLVGCATLFTQKAIVPASGLVLAIIVTDSVQRRWRGFASGVVMGCGILVPWGLATAWFAWHNAAGDFWRSAVYQLAVIPVRSSRWEHLRPTLSADLSVWLLAGWELIETWRYRRRPETWSSRRGLIAILTAWCVISLAWVKATFPQFYLLWMPFLAVLAARRIAAWSRSPEPWSINDRWLCAGFAGGLTLFETRLATRAARMGSAGAMPHLSTLLTPLALTSIAVFVLALLLMSIWHSVIQSNRRRGLVGLTALGLAYAVGRNLDGVAWSNESQVTSMRLVETAVPLEGRVLDGFTGLAPLRRHAYYFCWINEYSGALMSPEDREHRLLSVLQESPPAAVLFDEQIQKLPDSVTGWIREHYHPSEPAPLWLPTDVTSPKEPRRP
jgi:4-amino-4-deoxy-L-arabinose transferase-like glycosyltransferase